MTWLNWPNRITLVRIALVPPFVICLLNMNTGWAGSRHLAIVLFGVMALSDALDGFLARRLNQSTPLGRFLDPIADKLLISCAVVLLAVDATSVSGFRLPSWVPVIAIGKDALTVIGFGLVYATTGQSFVEPRPWGKACTLLQLVMVAYALLAPDMPAWLHWLSPATWWTASVLAIIALVDYVRVGIGFAAKHEITG